MGCSRSLKMALFDRPYSTFYWSAIVNISLSVSCIICDRKRDIGRKSWFFSYHVAFDSPVRGSPSEYCYPVWYGKKLWQYVKLFSSKRGTLRADGQTKFLYQYRASVWWRAIKTVLDRAIFTMADQSKVVYGLSNSAIFDDLEQPLTQFSRSRYSLTLNIS